MVECENCGGSGFDKPGTGYDAVCDECGGLGEHPSQETMNNQEQLHRIQARLDQYVSKLTEDVSHEEKVFLGGMRWLIERVQELGKALEFYANHESYELWQEAEEANLTGFYSDVDMDGGDKARQALKGESE